MILYNDTTNNNPNNPKPILTFVRRRGGGTTAFQIVQTSSRISLPFPKSNALLRMHLLQFFLPSTRHHWAKQLKLGKETPK